MRGLKWLDLVKDAQPVRALLRPTPRAMTGSTSLAYIDSQQLIILVFLIVMIAAVMAMAKIKPTPESTVEGPMSIILKWPNDPEKRTDMDLWVAGPDGIPVGYSAKEAPHATLLHDDLGGDAITAADGKHWEKVTIRDLIAGEYIVNVHSYGGYMPQDSWVTVQKRDMASGETDTLWTKHLHFTRLGDEQTAGRFMIAKDGSYVPETLSDMFFPLRNKK